MRKFAVILASQEHFNSDLQVGSISLEVLSIRPLYVADQTQSDCGQQWQAGDSSGKGR